MSDGFWLGLLKSILAQPGGGVGGSVSVPVTTTFSSPIPQRPFIIHNPSPNRKSAPGRQVTCVIIHATATPMLASPLAWLCDPKSGVSAHYLIDKDGTVYQLVHDDDIAWHAGESFWQGRSSVNAFSIGIELVNMNDGVDPYPEAQKAACAQLTKAICSERGIPMDYNGITGHENIAPGRKHDPGMAWPWPEFYARLA